MDDSISGLVDRAERPSRSKSRTGRSRWMLAACTILAVGMIFSIVSGLSWRSNAAAQDRQSFQSASGDVNETLGTLLSDDADFVAGLRAVLTMRSHLSATNFNEWFSELQGRRRQVGGLGKTVVEAVPGAGLAAPLLESVPAASPPPPPVRPAPPTTRGSPDTPPI